MMRWLNALILLFLSLPAHGAVSRVVGGAVNDTRPPFVCVANMVVQPQLTRSTTIRNDVFGFVIHPATETGYFLIAPDASNIRIDKFTLNPLAFVGTSGNIPALLPPASTTLAISTTHNLLGIVYRPTVGADLVAATYDLNLTLVNGPNAIATGVPIARSVNLSQQGTNYFYAARTIGNCAASRALTVYEIEFISATSTAATGLSFSDTICTEPGWIGFDDVTVYGSQLAIGTSSVFDRFLANPIVYSGNSFTMPTTSGRFIGLDNPHAAMFEHENNNNLKLSYSNPTVVLGSYGTGLAQQLNTVIDSLREKIYVPLNDGVNNIVRRINLNTLATEQTVIPPLNPLAIATQIDLTNNAVYIGGVTTNTERITKITLCN